MNTSKKEKKARLISKTVKFVLISSLTCKKSTCKEAEKLTDPAWLLITAQND